MGGDDSSATKPDRQVRFKQIGFATVMDSQKVHELRLPIALPDSFVTTGQFKSNRSDRSQSWK